MIIVIINTVSSICVICYVVLVSAYKFTNEKEMYKVESKMEIQSHVISGIYSRLFLVCF